LVLSFGAALITVVIAMVIAGAANGPLDLGMFSLRQRATEPAWFGRAFAVSMSLNYLGVPLGAAIAGPVVSRSATAAFLLAAGLIAVSATMPYGDLFIRRRWAMRSAVSSSTCPSSPPP
jgi:predicted MFS family arabinose efflux permease